MIVLETFTLDGKTYHKGDKIENVSKRFVELGLVAPEKALKPKAAPKVEPKAEVKEVLLTEDTSDVEVVKEEVKAEVKPLKKTKI